MKIRRLLLVLALLSLSSTVYAQTPVNATTKFTYDVTGMASLAQANGLIVKGYPDGSLTSIPITGHACVGAAGAGNYTCTANLPALTPAPAVHTMTVTITLSGVESGKSNTLAGLLYLVFSVGNLRLEQVP